MVIFHSYVSLPEGNIRGFSSTIVAELNEGASIQASIQTLGGQNPIFFIAICATPLKKQQVPKSRNI
jgi:hypothetical protein